MADSALAVGDTSVRQHDGLFSLNDLHAASGGEAKHRPNQFLRADQTKALVAELETAQICAVKTIEGRNGGTYACRELVIAYAAWISAAFHLKVIRVFLGQAAAPKSQPEPQQARIEHTTALDRAEAALQAAGVAAFQVHMAVGRAVLAGGEDWQQTCWKLSFDSSKGMVAPVVEPLAGNSQATTKRELMRLMDEVTQVSQKLQAAMGGVQ
jgi:hypothetical protein